MFRDCVTVSISVYPFDSWTETGHRFLKVKSTLCGLVRDNKTFCFIHMIFGLEFFVFDVLWFWANILIILLFLCRTLQTTTHWQTHSHASHLKKGIFICLICWQRVFKWQIFFNILFNLWDIMQITICLCICLIVVLFDCFIVPKKRNVSHSGKRLNSLQRISGS